MFGLHFSILSLHISEALVKQISAVVQLTVKADMCPSASQMHNGTRSLVPDMCYLYNQLCRVWILPGNQRMMQIAYDANYIYYRGPSLSYV